jgi:hypothetical protein
LRHRNLSFDTAACSTIGGASLGLFFFVLDAIEGHAFFTPMLLGSVLFEGMPATEAAQLSVPIIAGYTWSTLACSPSSGWRRRSSLTSPTTRQTPNP